MKANMKTAAIILAAGKGVRAGGGVPKQYRELGGEPVLRKTVTAFLDHPDVDIVQVVTSPDDDKLYKDAVKDLALPAPVAGGVLRQDSVLKGLQALESENPGIVLIHDAARAFVSADVIGRVIGAVKKYKCGAVPAIPVADTLKKGKDAVEKTVDRTDLWAAQTPQGFPFKEILAAHGKTGGKEFTDDAAVAEAAGLQVKIVAGDKENIKLTNPEDFKTQGWDIRTGTGFDVHAFEAGDHVILCGVKIPHDKALKGHSDADAGLHAITDAILGAIGEGDIGDHFPPSDDQWKNAPSKVFLEHAAKLAKDKGGRIVNVDLTLICEGPKIGPHRDAMREKVAEILDLDVARVSVKATTTEKLGFTGRGDGIAAQALATVAFGG